MKYLLLCSFLFLACAESVPEQKIIVLSEDLELHQLSEHTWLHKSWMNSEEYGRFSANGIVYIKDGEAIVGDTPTTEELSVLLLDWLEEQELSVKAVIVNHHHVDALGGLPAFHQRSIPSYGHQQTQALTENPLLKPWHTFSDSLSLAVGSESVSAYYFGKAHTADNIVLWVPEEHVLFGGCMVKSLKAGKGNLADADVEAWPKTIKRIQSYFPKVETVIPGHGAHGSTDLLDATIRIISEN